MEKNQKFKKAWNCINSDELLVIMQGDKLDLLYLSVTISYIKILLFPCLLVCNTGCLDSRS